MIVINFKTYPQASGAHAVRLAKICEQASQEAKVNIWVALQATDIFRVASQVKVPIFGQHVDPFLPGKGTGLTTTLALKQAGAYGVLLNHSEHPFHTFENLATAIKLAKTEGLKTLVFARDLAVAQKVDQFNPDYLALEEPTLISSETAMIDKPKAHHLIRKFVSSVKATSLIGAGIKNREDIFHNLKLGIKGVVLASHFILSSDPKAFLLSCTSAFLAK